MPEVSEQVVDQSMRLIGYLRVSTDDKGQNPERQKDVIQAWAKANGHQIPAWVYDEGTSGETDPLKRQYGLEAIEEAKTHGCEGIVAESVDRWTRAGPDALAVSRFFLRIDHGLRLVLANTPPGMTKEMEQMWDSMMATVAAMFLARLKESIKSGIARAKANGWPNGEPGRKRKPSLTPKEWEAVSLWIAEGKGVDKMALDLSHMRGAFTVADTKAQDRLRVKPTWLYNRITSEMPSLAERLAAKGRGRPAQKQVESERKEATA